MAPLNAFVRWRPLATDETVHGEIDYGSTSQGSGAKSVVSLKGNGTKPWNSAPAFTKVFEPNVDNFVVFETVVAPFLKQVLQGGNCNVFAYGHSGSGKTHTVIGYDFDDDRQLGLCLATANTVFKDLKILNADRGTDRLGVGFSFFEMRKDKAYDLLNSKIGCHIRQGHDGKTHVRGPTETLEEGKVRVRPIVKMPCWDLEALRSKLKDALSQRQVGKSSVHDQSSRTHAVLELEIVTQALVDAREAVIERESELVPVGKRATDIMVEEQTKGVIILPGGGYRKNPDYEPDQEKIDEANAEKRIFEERVAEAEQEVTKIIQDRAGPACLGGKMVFVDLAGAEYQQDHKGGLAAVSAQTPQEKQEGRQINTDLLALKEVIRARAGGQKRIPYRNSPLTMVLREHFEGAGSNSAIIVTVSPASKQEKATVNSLKYGGLVGVAGSV